MLVLSLAAMRRCPLVVDVEKEKNVSPAEKLTECHGGAHDGELNGDGADDDGFTVVYQGMKRTMDPWSYCYESPVDVSMLPSTDALILRLPGATSHPDSAKRPPT